MNRLVEIAAILPEPWSVFTRAFEARKDGSRTFSQVQRQGKGRYGFVLCRWSAPGLPEEYYSESQLGWVRFDYQYQVQDPQIYLLFRNANSAIERLEREDRRIAEIIRKKKGIHSTKPETRVGLWPWVHPEVSDRPLTQYLKMLGFQFPGSPRQ